VSRRANRLGWSAASAVVAGWTLLPVAWIVALSL